MPVNVVSLFSGGGGLDLGFKNAGYNILWAIDNNQDAVNTYKVNIGEHIICADINKIDEEQIPHADVVIGGPPCQSFSLAGNRHVEDARGQLVWRYIKMRRVIIVGLNNSQEFSFPTPTHNENGTDGLKKYLSVKEALGDLPTAIQDENALSNYKISPYSDYQKRMRKGCKAVSEQFMPKLSELDKYIISHVKPGGNYMDIPPDVNSVRIRRLQKEGGHTTCYGRLSPNKPSYTINTYFNRPNVGCNIHYSENRLITVREALRLQSFPDSYRIVSSSKQGRNLIVGNAVPPLLAEVIANELKKYLK